MSIYNVIPEKIITKIPVAIAWVLQSLFAAALPDVYQKVPQHLMVAYLGLTSENLNRLKYFTPALFCTVAFYYLQLYSQFNITPIIKEHKLKCCTA